MVSALQFEDTNIHDTDQKIAIRLLVRLTVKHEFKVANYPLHVFIVHDTSMNANYGSQG